MLAKECTQLEPLTRERSSEFKLKPNGPAERGGFILKTCSHSAPGGDVTCCLACDARVMSLGAWALGAVGARLSPATSQVPGAQRARGAGAGFGISRPWP